jgi:hypothetical protein
MQGCIEWTLGRSSTGYGVCRRNGRTVGAHRAAWEEVHGPIPEGLWVLHRCDNPPCVNVDHLFLGTRLDNVRDMDAKGRGRRPVLPGERNGRARFTEDDVRTMRDRYAAGESQTAIARRFNTSQSRVSEIVLGKSWRCVPSN